MNARRQTREQLAGVLNEWDRMLNDVRTATEVASHFGITRDHLISLRSYVKMKAPDVKAFGDRESQVEDHRRQLDPRSFALGLAKDQGFGKLQNPNLGQIAAALPFRLFGVSEQRACEISEQPRSTQ